MNFHLFLTYTYANGVKSSMNHYRVRYYNTILIDLAYDSRLPNDFSIYNDLVAKEKYEFSSSYVLRTKNWHWYFYTLYYIYFQMNLFSNGSTAHWNRTSFLLLFLET